LSALVAVFLVGGLAGAQQVQPGYDVIRVVDEAGNAIPYVVWHDWSPTIVAAPDGGAWAFFSAQPAGTVGAGGRGYLYVARFDPGTAVWQPARRIPGSEVAFGPSAVVDGEGRVHLVFSARSGIEPTDFSRLVYMVSDANGGWSEPATVAVNESAGHQLTPRLAIDGNAVLHLVWQDQRSRPPEQRDPQVANASSNADIFSSDLVDGAWTAPTQINQPGTATEAASRPQVSVDGDRLVAVWSVYADTTDAGLNSAVRLEWATRPLNDPAAWSEPQTLLTREGDASIGGRLYGLFSDPTGGVLLFVGRRSTTNDLYLRRLASGATEWSEEVLVSTGDKGSYPAFGVGPDGIAYAVYENGYGNQVDVGGFAVAAGQSLPGPDMVISPAEGGAQGRPGMTVDPNGGIWVIYFHQPVDGQVIEVRVLRRAQVPTEPAAAPVQATPTA
jgi:hypothetical protein